MCPVEYVRSEVLVKIEHNLRKADTKECDQKKNKTSTKRKQDEPRNIKTNMLASEDKMNDVDVDENENNRSIVVYEEISPEVVVNEETLNCDSENEDEDHANNDSGDEVGWKNEIDSYLEDIIEYYKQTEDQLHEVSASGNHLLIKAVEDQTDVKHVDEVDQDNEMSNGAEVEDQNDVKHVDEVGQDNEITNGSELEAENGIKQGDKERRKCIVSIRHKCEKMGKLSKMAKILMSEYDNNKIVEIQDEVTALEKCNTLGKSHIGRGQERSGIYKECLTSNTNNAFWGLMLKDEWKTSQLSVLG
ncbi:hypothetical protein QVD17_07634 [Tagetes erecta]|uniref:Uncharacterized protein n=1 Tax=Tagetes erecta TaxID=13708 RepID=A0AAD8LHF1_TARER|nr:hypothetical protein QVD17_07634 [Tagetes erecta]